MGFLKFLIVALLFISTSAQIFQGAIIMLQYELNTAYITKAFCINKNKPQLHCNGKCHLKKELSKAAKEQDNKSIVLKSIKQPLYCNNMTNSPVITSVNFSHNFFISNCSLVNSGCTRSIFRPPLV